MESELPPELLPYKQNIEASIRPYIEIKAQRAESLRLWQSKFGGLPYLPKGFQHPTDTKNEAMLLLTQINFSETPKLKHFPDKGILQFFISGSSDVYGTNFNDLASQEDFRILYFPEVVNDESALESDFGYLLKPDLFPLEEPCALTFSFRSAPMPAVDYQFEFLILQENTPAGKDELYVDREDLSRVLSEYEKLFKSEGHKLGGYPYFTQNDLRQFGKYKEMNYVLLFQMDSDEEAGILWGDVGVANFFIQPQDLEKKDFSNVLYTWDCC